MFVNVCSFVHIFGNWLSAFFMNFVFICVTLNARGPVRP